MSGLRGDQRVQLAAVVLIIGETFINLGARQPWKTSYHLVHGRSGFRHRYHVMHADARTFHDRVARTHPRSLHNVTVTRRNHALTVPISLTDFKLVEMRASGAQNPARLAA